MNLETLGDPMKKKNRIRTAGELTAELQKDPQWVARQKADQEYRDLLGAEFSRLEFRVLEDLQKLGLDVPSVGNGRFFEKYMPLSSEIVNVLLKWLPNVHWRVQEPIVRLLTTASKPFDGQVLASLFDYTLSLDTDKLDTDHAIALGPLRWAIGNAIAEARPYGISDWILRTAKDRLVGKSKEMLLVAVGRMFPAETAREILLPLFEEYPLFCAHGLGEKGGEIELEFLTKQRDSFKGESKKVFDRAIRKIERRLKKKA
jgi:hypothetical protein